MIGDRPVLGIFLMLGFCVLAPLGDSIAKVLGQSWPLLTLLIGRFAIQFLVLLPLAARMSFKLSPRGWRLTIVRTLLHIIGIGLMFQALRFLPLADAVAIAFVMPFIMLLLGRFVLGEEVGSRRLAACAVGFCGTLLVVQPSFVEVGAAAFLPMGVAVVFAFFMLVTRQVAREADPITLQTISGGIATLVLLPLLLIFGTGGIQSAPATDLLLILVLGLLGTGAHLFMTWALRLAPSATLAPMQYLEIPIAAVIGWLIFRDFPNGIALLGIAITIAAGLYVIAREQTMARRLARGLPPQAPPAAE
jgi:drug/metabolite transporter (DMT)-like permease